MLLGQRNPQRSKFTPNQNGPSQGTLFLQPVQVLESDIVAFKCTPVGSLFEEPVALSNHVADPPDGHIGCVETGWE